MRLSTLSTARITNSPAGSSAAQREDLSAGSIAKYKVRVALQAAESVSKLKEKKRRGKERRGKERRGEEKRGEERRGEEKKKELIKKKRKEKKKKEKKRKEKKRKRYLCRCN